MRAVIITAAIVLLAMATASAQQATVATPFHAVGDSFHESIGTNWGLSGKNWSFSFGAPGMAPAPFGGGNPQAGANLGVARVGRDVSGYFNLHASQGSRRSYTSQSPSVTNMNGMPGYFHDTSLSPFVIGFVPVVGGAPIVGYANPARMPAMRANPAYSSPVARAMANYRSGRPLSGREEDEKPEPDVRPRYVPNPAKPVDSELNDDLILIGPGAQAAAGNPAQPNTAGQPAPSVAQVERTLSRQRARLNEEAQDWFNRGTAAEQAGKTSVAKLYYQMSARRASGEFKQQVQARLDGLK